jgi:hypothetical protein
MTDFAWPQDAGIGTHPSGSGDKNDAANFAAAYDALGKTDYVKQGIGFTVDYTAPSVDISGGKAVVTEASATATQESEERDEGVAFVVELDARTGLSLTDGAVNHVFIDLSLGSDDATSFHIDTDNTPPSQPYLKVGEIDTRNDTKSELNRKPSEEFESASIDETRTETLEYDYSSAYPQWPRQPEQSSPLNLQPHPHVSNPVLSAADVTDVSANFVADPFIVHDNGTFHLFFEVEYGTGPDYGIGHATSPDGLSWTYDQLVISASGHYAYPYVLKHNGTWYMLPDRGQDNKVEIYEATTFPTDWSVVETPLTGRHVDPTPFKFNGTWYMFTTDTSASPQQLQLFYSESLIGGSWTEHPSSPVHSSTRNGRTAGRPIVHDDYVDIFMMDNQNGYGDTTRYYRITDLSTSTYSDYELSTSPLLQSSNNGSWTDQGMHHIDMVIPNDAPQSFAIVDGKNASRNWEIGVYTTGDATRSAFRMTLGANQSISSGSWNHIQWDTFDFDLAQSYDTANDEFVAPSTGYYELNAAVKLDVPSGNTEYPFREALRIYDEKNVTELATDHAHIAVDGDVTASVSTQVRLAEGQRVSVDVFQDSGTAKDATSGLNNSWFGGRRIY